MAGQANFGLFGKDAEVSSPTLNHFGAGLTAVSALTLSKVKF